MTTRYTARIDPDAIVALDVHAHIEADDHGRFSLDRQLMDASATYFRAGQNRTPTIDQIAAYYRERSMVAVVFTVDAMTATGHAPLSSEQIAEQAADYADVLIPFGSVDPLRRGSAVEQARRLVVEYGVRGFKFHPSLQGFARATAHTTRSGRRWRSWRLSRCSTQDRPASVPEYPAGDGLGCPTPTRSCLTTSPPTSLA